MTHSQFKTLALGLLLMATLSSCALIERTTADMPPGDKAPTGEKSRFGPAPALPRRAATDAQAAAASSADAVKSEAKLYTGTGAMVKQTPPAAPAPAGAEEIVLNFEGADIRVVIETILSNYMREPYLVHPSVAGTITLRTTRGIARKDLVSTLEMLLRQNGAALIKEEGIYKVLPFAQVRGSITPQLGGSSTALPSGFSVIIVPLKFTGAKAMQQLLEPFAAGDGGVAIRADEVRNLLVLAGSQRELRHLTETIELFDVDFLAGMSVGLFPIKSVDVKGLSAEIDKLFSATGNPLAGIVRIIPIERLNALLIVTPQPHYLQEAKKWIERLDQSTGKGGGLFVYQVRNGKAETLASLLSEIFGGGKAGGGTTAPQLAPGARPAEIRSPTGAPAAGLAQPNLPVPASAPAGTTQFSGDGVIVSKDVRVVADKDNNALLIIASQADYEKIEQALKQLDVVRRQVLVEVMIAEVRLSDELRFGVEWFITARNNTTGALRMPTGASLSSVLPRTPGVTAGTDPRSVVNTTGGLQLINMVGGDIRGILQALGSDGRAQLISTPQIMALDNERAQIKVGERISVQTGSQTTGTTTGVITTEQYIDTGVLLSVTPRINASGQVTMEINQEVSEIGESRAGSNNPNIISRNFQTSATVSSGDTMVLAGLMRKNRRTGTAGLPIISKIPVIGGLFGVQNFAEEKTELVILITPRVVSNSVQATEVTNELRRKLPSLEAVLPKPKSQDRVN